VFVDDWVRMVYVFGTIVVVLAPCELLADTEVRVPTQDLYTHLQWLIHLRVSAHRKLPLSLSYAHACIHTQSY
jgi:hypothetical protein